MFKDEMSKIVIIIIGGTSNTTSVSRREAEREDRRPACRVPSLSDRPSNPHKEKQKNFFCFVLFPFVFLEGSCGKGVSSSELDLSGRQLEKSGV